MQIPERYVVVYRPLLDASPVSVEAPSDKPYCERGGGIRDARPATLGRYRDHLHDTDFGSLSTQLASRRIPASIIPAWHMISLWEVKNKNAT